MSNIDNKNQNAQFGIINPQIAEAYAKGKIISMVPPKNEQNEIILPKWKCTCGLENTAKRCNRCNAEKPKEFLRLRCAKCGWMPEPKFEPKFCIECGDPFTDEDYI